MSLDDALWTEGEGQLNGDIPGLILWPRSSSGFDYVGSMRRGNCYGFAINIIFFSIELQFLINRKKNWKAESVREKWNGFVEKYLIVIATNHFPSVASIRRKLLKTTHTEGRSYKFRKLQHSTLIVNKFTSIIFRRKSTPP